MLQAQPGWQFPLLEASALCLRHGDARGTAELLAVDDEAYHVGVAEITDGLKLATQPVSVEGAVPDAQSSSSEFEGVASDGSRQVFVLQEGASRILVFDADLRRLNHKITLSLPHDQTRFRR